MSEQTYLQFAAPRDHVSNPLDDLWVKLRADQDRRDELAIEGRAVAHRAGLIRDELAALDVAIRQTRGLLVLAAAQQQAATADADLPKRPARAKRQETTP